MLVKIEHPNAITCWKTVGLNANGDLQVTLMVETDLFVTKDMQGYDDKKLDDLAKVVVAYLSKHKEIDRAAFHSLPEVKNAKGA